MIFVYSVLCPASVRFILDQAGMRIEIRRLDVAQCGNIEAFFQIKQCIIAFLASRIIAGVSQCPFLFVFAITSARPETLSLLYS